MSKFKGCTKKPENVCVKTQKFAQKLNENPTDFGHTNNAFLLKTFEAALTSEVSLRFWISYMSQIRIFYTYILSFIYFPTGEASNLGGSTLPLMRGDPGGISG